ncbi:MAG TPA: NAD(P)H-hydrate epimerase [Gemmatimonadota bacterium]|nr:NAD(P)H-hydrate epimerase [Gemmatimonadota bacterium]
MTIPVYDGDVPSLTTAQMIEVDRLMIEDYHIELVQMMENAGRNLAHLARVRFLGGDPRGKRVVVAAGSGGNGGGVPILALDAPSGIDATTGSVFDPAIRATATMTLALPKQGLGAVGVAEYVGELYLADIGLPPALYAERSVGVEVANLFAEDDIIRLA